MEDTLCLFSTVSFCLFNLFMVLILRSNDQIFMQYSDWGCTINLWWHIDKFRSWVPLLTVLSILFLWAWCLYFSETIHSLSWVAVANLESIIVSEYWSLSVSSPFHLSLHFLNLNLICHFTPYSLGVSLFSIAMLFVFYSDS